MSERLELLELLKDAPPATYLIELRGQIRLLWRLSEGEPADGALEPAPSWTMRSSSLVKSSTW